MHVWQAVVCILFALLVGSALVTVLQGAENRLRVWLEARRATRALEALRDRLDGDPADDDDDDETEFLTLKAEHRANVRAKKRAMPKALRRHYSRYGATTQYSKVFAHAKAC